MSISVAFVLFFRRTGVSVSPLEQRSYKSIAGLKSHGRYRKMLLLVGYSLFVSQTLLLRQPIVVVERVDRILE